MPVIKTFSMTDKSTEEALEILKKRGESERRSTSFEICAAIEASAGLKPVVSDVTTVLNGISREQLEQMKKDKTLNSLGNAIESLKRRLIEVNDAPEPPSRTPEEIEERKKAFAAAKEAILLRKQTQAEDELIEIGETIPQTLEIALAE